MKKRFGLSTNQSSSAKRRLVAWVMVLCAVTAFVGTPGLEKATHHLVHSFADNEPTTLFSAAPQLADQTSAIDADKAHSCLLMSYLGAGVHSFGFERYFAQCLVGPAMFHSTEVPLSGLKAIFQSYLARGPPV
jgi:hypothetical protein